MNAFDELINLPELRRLFDLAWHTFGVNPALVSMDGQGVVIFDPVARAQPFCRALNALPGGTALCSISTAFSADTRTPRPLNGARRRENRACPKRA